MDILLVNGIDYQVKITNPQIGQLIIRDILKEKYTVECVNFDYLAKTKAIVFKETIWKNVEIFTKYIYDKQPKIVGFYTICNSFLTTLLIAQKIRKERPEIKILFGGPHATLTAKECLSDFDCVDVIALGESEKTILPIVDTLMGDQDFSNLKGVAYKKGDEIFVNERESLLKNEELAQYTPVDYSPVEITEKTMIELEAGRGCPFSCSFCSTSPFWGRKFRIKSVDEIIGEMKQFHELYAVKVFSLVHDMFTVNRQHLTEFCNRMIDEDLPFQWGCSSRVDVLDEEIVELMKKAHCFSIYLGIETGSASMQKKVNKNLNLEHALSIIRKINELGLEFTASFIYGYPEETIEEFRETIGMMQEIMMTGVRNVQLHRFMLLPHTEETDKIYQDVYFNDNDVDFSIYDEKLYDNAAKDIIRNYPKEFIQFYTFDSEVRTIYKFFDSYEFYLVCGMGMYNCSIRYLLRKYGMEALYFKYLAKVEETYTNIRHMDIDAGSKVDSDMSEIYKYIKYMIQDELQENYTIELDQLMKYEDLLRDYAESKDKNPKYYRFTFDVIKARKQCIYEETECTIKFYYEGEKLRVSRVRIQKSTN